MTILDKGTVDFVSIDKASNDAILILADHLSWDTESEYMEHMLLIQEKINSYVSYVESGQLDKDYPSKRPRKVRIELVSKFSPPNSHTADFFDAVQSVLRSVAIEFVLSTK